MIKYFVKVCGESDIADGAIKNYDEEFNNRAEVSIGDLRSFMSPILKSLDKSKDAVMVIFATNEEEGKMFNVKIKIPADALKLNDDKICRYYILPGYIRVRDEAVLGPVRERVEMSAAGMMKLFEDHGIDMRPNCREG